MKLLKQEQKKQTFGGVFSTAAWVAIIGIGLLVASATQLVNTVASNNNANTNSTTTGASGSRPTASIRMSAVPSRSSVNFLI